MIKMSEYAKRRNILMQKIAADDIVIIPAANEVIRNGDATYPFRQHSDFYYLTGFEEPEAVMVLAPQHKSHDYILFNRPRNTEDEMWDGPRAGQQGACQTFLADESFAIGDFENRLPELLSGCSTIHYPVGFNKAFDAILMRAMNAMRAKLRGDYEFPIRIADVTPLVHEMRLFKSVAEIATMQQAVTISAAAHVKAMQLCRPGKYEYELEAAIVAEFVAHGARAPAYNSIVGAGANTCVLHYIKNAARIATGDLVLIDAGAEYQNYAADITRTFPSNGHFSAEQRAVYDIVLAAQNAAINSIKPGANWGHAQLIILKIVTQGLVDLRILKGRVSDLIEKKAYLPYYMHRSGHWLGLDVHDVGCYRNEGKWRALQPNMVLTVEPGLYLSADIPGLASRWHNIGVRIEDDVLVTAKSHDVLSAAVPKTVDAIQAVMAG